MWGERRPKEIERGGGRETKDPVPRGRERGGGACEEPETPALTAVLGTEGLSSEPTGSGPVTEGVCGGPSSHSAAAGTHPLGSTAQPRRAQGALLEGPGDVRVLSGSGGGSSNRLARERRPVRMCETRVCV